MTTTALPGPDAAPLEFTGERFTPECSREIWYEHWHRYEFARGLAAGKRVLDAACGEGYGSALLAGTAQSVVGVDIDAPTIRHAQARYGNAANVTFVQGDCTVLPFPERSFDVIVSFETLEHVAEQERLVAGFARLLADDGVLIVSSPDKRTYSDASGFRNEYHVRELYRDELVALLHAQFGCVRLFGQKLLFQSAIWQSDADATARFAAATVASGNVQSGLAYEPLYWLAVCTRQPLTIDLPALSLFGDREESVYSHYNAEVRKNMAAGARIAELERALAAASEGRDRREETAAHGGDSVASARPWWRRWLGSGR